MVTSKLLLGAILSSTSVLGAYIPHAPRAEPSKPHTTSGMGGYRTVSITSAGSVVSTMVYNKNMTMHGTGTGTGGTYMPSMTAYSTMKPGHNKTSSMKMSSYMEDEDDDMEGTSTYMMGGMTSTYGFDDMDDMTSTMMDDDMATAYPTMNPKHNMTKSHMMDDDDEVPTQTKLAVTFTGVSSMMMTSTMMDDEMETAMPTTDYEDYMPSSTDDEDMPEETSTMEDEYMPEKTSTMEDDMPEPTSTMEDDMPEPTSTMEDDMPEATSTMEDEYMPEKTNTMEGDDMPEQTSTMAYDDMQSTMMTEMSSTMAMTTEMPTMTAMSTTTTMMMMSMPASSSVTATPVAAIPTSPPVNVFTDKSRYQSYSKIPQDQLVYISNHIFEEVDKWGKIKLTANAELQNSMVAGKAWFEKEKEKNGKDTICTAPAYTGGEPQDTLIYCNKDSRYGIRINNLMDAAWSETCWDIVNNAVWLSQAITSGNVGIPEGEVPEYYMTANNPIPTRFFQHKEIQVTEGRPWNVTGQVFKGGNPLRMAYITLENPGCPDAWKNAEAAV
ncbi:hypothetical protein TWF173_005222 [Orbilia oligospora]|nr:hypothetical protein TWF173_005222 [Orbilia oligospora]